MQAEIIPETKTDRDSFTYKIPTELINKLSIGSIVYIEFGKRKIRGVVVKINKIEICPKYKIKTILSMEESYKLSSEYINIARWVSDYYLCSLGEAISLFLPPEMKRPRQQPSFAEKKVTAKLEKLTIEQRQIFEGIIGDFNTQRKPALIFGVTGSGKTEIYLALAKKMLEIKRSVIFLVPEIVLTPQNISRFQRVFGDEVCIMHSKLSKSEKYHCYLDFSSGKKNVIIGPRSALLVPSNNLGMIIIDEEQEDSYKQEQNPRYDATTLAEIIALKNNSMLVLGSATPRLETFFKAKKGIYKFYQMRSRYHQPKLPVAEIVDMKNELKSGNNSMISDLLAKRIEETIKNQDQVLLFLNRRGMSTFVSCRDCGEVINCSHCLVPMIYHFDKGLNYLLCHHCDRKQNPPKKCPSCGSVKIKYFGSGIEKVEREVKDIFPEARIKRVDSQILKTQSDYKKFYDDFRCRKFDIVIGTQILAKGFDIPSVMLVGIVSADVGLHLPFFRSRERIFRLITQVSGRSGRREKIGKTVIQTYWPNSEAIKFAANHDYENFYLSEIKNRIEKNYPPQNHIVRVLAENKMEERARDEIKKLSAELKNNRIELVGPGQCFFSKINNRFRFQLIIKVENLPDKRITEIKSRYQNLIWDVDPLNLL